MKLQINRQIEDRIERAFLESCPVEGVKTLDLPKVFAEGRRLAHQGCGDTELRVMLRHFVTEMNKGGQTQ